MRRDGRCAATPARTAACSSGAGPARPRSASASCPSAAAPLRQRIDGSLAGILLGAMIVLSLLCWGPIPLACLWVGSQVDYLSGSVSFGILVSFVGLFALLFGALALLRRLDQAWILVRRAAGHDQRSGRARTDLRDHRGVCALRLHVLVRRDPRPRRRIVSGSGGDEPRAHASAASEPRRRASLLERAEPWACSTTTASSKGCPRRRSTAACAQQAAERRRKALTRVETLDLSQTTWPELAHPSIVNAITFTARRGLQRYPHLRGSQLRDELAERHGVDSGRLILGNGAAELLSSATRALIEPGQRAAHLLALLPAVPDHGPPRPRPRGAGHRRRRRAAGGRRASEDTRVIALASPNDPTGELLPTRRARAAARRACPRASPCCSTSRSSSSPTPSRSTPRWSCSSTIRGCSCSAASPRPGAWRACASATRSAARARRSCSPSSSPTSASPRSPRRAPWRRCAAARSSSPSACADLPTSAPR